MRYTHAEGTPFFSLCLLCFVAGASNAQTTAAPTNTPITAPKIPPVNLLGGLKVGLATSYIIDRSPLATSAEQQITQFSTTYEVVGFGGSPAMAASALLTIVGLAGFNPQANDTDADLLNSVTRLQFSFHNPDKIAPLVGGIPGKILRVQRETSDVNAVRQRFFQFLKNEFTAPRPQAETDLDVIFNVIRKNLKAGAAGPEKQKTVAQTSFFAGQNAQPLVLVDAPVPQSNARALEKARLRATLTYLTERFVKQDRPLRRAIFAIEQQSRLFDKTSYFATSLAYSSAASRVDIVGQYLTGTNNGYGASVRYALDGYAPSPEPDFLTAGKNGAVLAAAVSNATGRATNPNVINALKQEIITEETTTEIIKQSLDAINYASLARYILRPHFSLAANFQHLNRIGDYYDLGVSASALQPTHFFGQHNALFYSIGLRYQWFAVGGGNSAASAEDIGSSFVLAFQNNAPHIDADGKTNLGRWHTRIGVEYAPRNALVQRDYGAFFLRLRDRKTGEYTLLLGSEVNGQAFVGLNASLYFGTSRRRDLAQ